MATETARAVSLFSDGSLMIIGCQGRVMSGQPAETAALYLKRTTKARAHVFERDGRSQIDDLLGVEVALEFVEDLVGNVDGGERHLFGVAERGALGGREQRILGGILKGGEFFVAYSEPAATGSVDVYSENAADHLGGAQTHHPLQRFRCDLGGFDRLHEDRHRDRNAGTISPRFERPDDFAEPPLHCPGQRLQHPTHLVFFEWFDTHLNKLRLRGLRAGGARFVRLTIENRGDRD